MSRQYEKEDHSGLLNSIFLGEVASVQNYGAFVKIPGSRDQGLIHRTQISNAPVEDATEILQRGERVWCKVISITEENKIALSMKVVDQGHGSDLDPAGVQIHQDEQRRKNYDPRGRKKAIELDAVFNTVCSKCGTHGHLKKDCFKSPDGKTYELILDGDEALNEPPSRSPPVEPPAEKPVSVKTKKDKKKKKKHKKEKSKKSSKHKHKKKKQKKKHSSSSDSSSSEGSSEESSEEGPRKGRGSTKQESSSRKREHSRSTSRHRDKSHHERPKR